MVTLNPNDSCNFACKYCFKQLENEQAHSMSKATVKDAVAFCRRNKITSITIPEKEPMLDAKLLQFIIEQFTEAGIRVSGVTTNLYNLPFSIIETLRAHNVRLLVSYDGIWQDNQRFLRSGSPTNSVVKKNIYALKGAEIPFGIACTITRECADSINENYEYLKGITPSIAFNFDVSSDYAVTESELPLIEEEFQKIASKDMGIFPLHKIHRRLKNGSRYTNMMCGAGRGSFTIDWDGTLYPCYHAIAWKNIGINLGSIYEGINEENRKMFRETDTATPKMCAECKTALCGICYTTSYDVTGQMNMPIPINCKLLTTLTEIVRRAM